MVDRNARLSRICIHTRCHHHTSDTPPPRRNRQGEGGRGSTGKDANVQDMKVKADGEGINIPSSYPVYRDSDGFGDKNDGRGRPQLYLRLRPIPKDNLKKQNPISMGGLV